MEKSRYGSETVYLWRGCLAGKRVGVVQAPSTLKISPDDQREIEENWAKVREQNPDAFDGPLWRYEYSLFDGE